MDEHEPPDGVTPADAAAARRIADELRTFVEDGGPNVQALWNRAMDELAENGSVTLTPADGDALLTAMVEDATTPDGLAALRDDDHD